jgi:hypothetical protein
MYVCYILIIKPSASELDLEVDHSFHESWSIVGNSDFAVWGGL